MKAGICFIAGLLLALGGVGGVEVSADNTTLLQAFVVSLVGCALMQVGISYLKEDYNA
jgi:hypothetical protein